jgi:hypothetical protein
MTMPFLSFRQSLLIANTIISIASTR